MKTIERCIYNLKVGDVVRLGNLSGKVLNIRKKRGIFMAGSLYQVVTDCMYIGTFSVYGIHWYAGRKYPAEKVTIIETL